MVTKQESNRRYRQSHAVMIAKKRQYALDKLTADPDDPRHGKYTGYNLGCRCDACKAAGKAYRVRTYSIHLKQMQKDPKDPRHGTYMGYVYGCRCDACKEAQRQYRKQRIERLAS